MSISRTRSGSRRAAAILTVATLFTLVPITSAHACSCAGGSVSSRVQEADHVYVGRPRAVDLLPGASFRIDRVLKGEPRSNARVRVMKGPGASCGTRVGQTAYVLAATDTYGFLQLSYCTSYLRGPEAVLEAERILGVGERVPSRPALDWWAQWVALALLVVTAVVVIRMRRSARAR